VQVGDLVTYSQEWRNEALLYEDDVLERHGVGLILEEEGFALGGKIYHILWSADSWKTWERDRDLELVNENR
jgi:hypothetical protein